MAERAADSPGTTEAGDPWPLRRGSTRCKALHPFGQNCPTYLPLNQSLTRSMEGSVFGIEELGFTFESRLEAREHQQIRLTSKEQGCWGRD